MNVRAIALNWARGVSLKVFVRYSASTLAFYKSNLILRCFEGIACDGFIIYAGSSNANERSIGIKGTFSENEFVKYNFWPLKYLLKNVCVGGYVSCHLTFLLFSVVNNTQLDSLYPEKFL